MPNPAKILTGIKQLYVEAKFSEPVELIQATEAGTNDQHLEVANVGMAG